MEACPSFRFNAAHLSCSRPQFLSAVDSGPALAVGSQLSQRTFVRGSIRKSCFGCTLHYRKHAHPLDACIESLRALHRRASSLHATWRLKINVRSGTKILRSVQRALRNRAGSYLVKWQVQTKGERP
jgi:hypothetical protein